MRALTRLALLLCLLGGFAAPGHTQDEPLNRRVFDKVWRLVGERYWDRDMQGLDWNAARDRYYPQAIAARSEQQLYAVVNRMLGQLDDSHVYATSPAQLRRSRGAGEIRDMAPARQSRWLDDGILLLTFNQFDPGDDRWIRREIEAVPDARGVILDLRHNLGGRDDILDRVAGLFTTRRTLLIRLNGRRDIDEMTRGAGSRAYQGPLAVIVGPRTASAAEILAVFLEESGRAYTIGERTAGAVTGGVDYGLPGGGRLTIAEYDIRTARGTRLEGTGFTPKYPAPAASGAADAALARATALIRAAGNDRRPNRYDASCIGEPA